MAQIKIPSEFLLQVTLLSNIIAKNNAPDFESPLTDWLLQNNINLAADAEAASQANDKEKARAQQDALSKGAFESRDAKFTPVFTFIRGGAQVLKNYYINQPSILADWGIHITGNRRIVYPASFEDRQALAVAFFTKLASFPDGKSPLGTFIINEKVNVTDLSKDNTTAGKNNTDADVAAKAAENATEQRDLLWAQPLAHIHLIADYLKTVYASNPRALGEWGFVVDESERKPKLRKSKLGFAETKVFTAIALNSILTNTGKGNLIVYKGRIINGSGTTLKPGDKMGILKGYSVITVSNPSTLEMGEFTVEMNK